MRKLFQINDKIKNHQGEIIICGTSPKSICMFSVLLKENIYVSCFLSLEEGYDNVKIMNKPIYTLEMVKTFMNPLFLIVDQEGEKIRLLLNKKDNSIIFSMPLRLIEERISSNCLVTRFQLWTVLEAVKEKKVIIYGNTKEGQELSRILQLCNTTVSYVVDELANGEVKSVWDLVYEDFEDIFVILAKKEDRKAKQNLEQIGLKEVSQFREIECLINHYPVEYYLDVQLGHTYKSENEKYFGIRTFGEWSDNAYKIITLGGSTTDPKLYPFKSWSEVLYEILKEAGHNVSIICAGCSSYTASQELLKLERDLINLGPNLVISYSGINDIYYEDNYKFASQYHRMVFRTFTAVTQKVGRITWEGVCSGEENLLNAFDWWLKCEYMMKGICQVFDINFMGICQAMLGGKEFYTAHDKEIILNGARNGKASERYRNDFEKARIFRNEIKKYSRKEFLYDMTGLLDNQNVYIDECHVTEEGNCIIAKEIYKKMLERGLLNYGKDILSSE